MSILDPVADLLGVSPTFIVIAVLAFAVLVLGWYALKALLKLTWRIFAVGLSLLIAVALLFGLVLFIAEAL